MKRCNDLNFHDSAGNNYEVPPDVLACFKKYESNFTAQLEFCDTKGNWINAVLAFNINTGEVPSKLQEDVSYHFPNGDSMPREQSSSRVRKSFKVLLPC